MGGKTATTTQQVQIPEEVLARYNASNEAAASAAANPFQIYSTDPSAFVAPLNQQQLAGTAAINAAAGSGQPYFTQAGQAIEMGMGSAQPGELQISEFMNPYQQDVIDATMAQLAQSQEQAQSGALGTAVSSGAFGGDRAGIAAANLANQQSLATGSTLAGLNAENYNQALAAAQQQQQIQLAAEQADLARYMQGAGMYAGLGSSVLQGGLAGGEAMINAGTLGQQTEQAGLSALYNQFLQEQAYPFQTAQFLSNIAMGTGALSGSTTTTEQPVPYFSDRRLKEGIRKIGSTDDGLPIYSFRYKGDPNDQTHIGFMADEVEKKKPDAVGVAPNGYKTVDYDRATRATGGGVAGPYGSMVGSQPGMASYVPEAFLPISDLMMADTSIPDMSSQALAAQMDAAARFGEDITGLRDTYGRMQEFLSGDEQGAATRAPSARRGRSAMGGVVPAYAYGGSAEYLKTGTEKNPVTTKGYLGDTVDKQEEAKRSPTQPSSMPGQPQSVMGQIGDAAGTVSSIIAAGQALAALSDRRAKEGIRKIGSTDDGLPIYSFRYKGDNREQTHVGFMADEVEKQHPEAVHTGPDGMKRVDYSQAHKFYRGGGVRPAYQDGGSPGYSPSVMSDIERRNAIVAAAEQEAAAERAQQTPEYSPPGVAPVASDYGRYSPSVMGDIERRNAIVAAEEGQPLPDGVELYPSPPSLPAQSGLGMDRVMPAPTADMTPAEQVRLAPTALPSGLAPPVALRPPARPAGLVPAPVAPGRPQARPAGLVARSMGALDPRLDQVGGLTPAAVEVPAAPSGVAPRTAPQVAQTMPTRPNYPATIDDARGFFRSSIIPQESGGRQFDENGNPLQSPAGAIGIAQVMPDTAPEAARLAGLEWDEERYRTDPEYNAALGEAYFVDMYRQFADLGVASAAYNAGPGAVRNAMERAAREGGSYLDYLPLETQNYVQQTAERAGASAGSGSGESGGREPVDERQGGVGGFMRNMMYIEDPETGERRVNPDFIFSLLGGLGTMASSPSLYAGSAFLQGLGGFANTYTGLQRLRPEIARTEAEAGLTRAQERAQQVTASTASFFQTAPGGAMMFLADPSNPASAVPLSVFLDNPQAFTTGNPNLDRQLVEEAQRRQQQTEGTVFSLPVVEDAIARDTRMVSVNPALREQSNAFVESAERAAELARAFKPTSVLQAGALANIVSGDANLRTGAFGQFQSQALQYANALLAAAGMPPISGADDAQLVQKVSTLQAVMASQGAGQESFNAMAQILQTAPGVSLEPETNAALMASLLVDQQRNIDLGEFTRQYMTAPGNSMGLANGAAQTFDEIYGRRLIAEKDALKNLILNGGEYLQMALEPSMSEVDRNELMRKILVANGMTDQQLSAISDASGNIYLSRYFGG